MTKPSYFSLLVVIMLVLCSSLLQNSMAQPPLTSPSSCSSKCGMRCANAGVKDRCMKYCGICCKQCSCVPSGTYGNKSECPCYRDMLNAKGKPKCP